MKKNIIAVVAGTAVLGSGVAIYKNREEIKSFANKKAKEIAQSRSIKNTTKGLIHLNAVMNGKKRQTDSDLAIANLLIAYPMMEASDNDEVHDTLVIVDIAIEAAKQKGVDIDAITEFSKKLLEDYMADVISKTGEEFDLSEEDRNEMQAAFCEGMKAAMNFMEEEPVNV